MRKQWIALLSVLGLTGPVLRSESQVLKGSKQAGTQATTSENVKKNEAVQNPKLGLKQQTLRQQTPGGGKQADTMTPSAYCNKNQTANNQQITKGAKANAQLTPPPPGANNAVTKGNQQITKGNQQITKGNQQITKGNQQITKGDQQITKGGNLQITKGNQQITKGNQQITKGNQQITKGNQQITKGNQQVTKGNNAITK